MFRGLPTPVKKSVLHARKYSFGPTEPTACNCEVVLRKQQAEKGKTLSLDREFLASYHPTLSSHFLFFSPCSLWLTRIFEESRQNGS